MPYLMIENPVKSVPSVELMRMLGASSSRGNAGRIGQFGSGFPYSLALLARHGLLAGTKICLSKDVYTFELEPHNVKDASGRAHVQHEIRMRKQNGGTWDLNISTQFGAIDWRNVNLAVREFVSNAIDGVYDFGGNPSKDVVIDATIPDEGRNTRAKDGFIRIYIPLTDDIQSYVDDIHKYFRCLSPGYNPDRSVWLNTDSGPARIYRKGVLVGSFGTSSLFHYNINDICLNESRIVDEYTARDACATAIARCESSNIIGKFLLHRLGPSPSEDCFEDNLYVREMGPSRLSFDDSQQEDRCNKAFTDAVKIVVGNKVVATSAIAAKVLESKGCEVVQTDSAMGDVLGLYGARTADHVLNKDELAGRLLSEATPELIKAVDYIWGVIDAQMMTYGRPKPGVKCFSQSVTVGMSGYVHLHRPKDNNIYIRSDIADGTNTAMMVSVLHELNHHITQADDSTYEFVDFAHKLAVALMMDGWKK